MLAVNQTLEDWFLHHDRSNSPGCLEYQHRYQALYDHLKQHVYPYVNASAALVDKDGYLTDHGLEHIKTVIVRASDLVRTQGHVLSWYEVYLLLTSILFHDVGNLYGRQRHERKAQEVMERVGLLLGSEAVEKRLIRRIAEAHGGTIDGDKDTISKLSHEDVILNRTVKPQALAALLRFADELADERSRAARYMLDNDLLPLRSEVFHKYASALHSIRLNGNMVELYFEIVKSDALRTFTKGDDQVFLFDEIKLRVKKMHFERIYCMRHLRIWFRIDKIRVQIGIYEDDWGPIIREIHYVFEEDGYPDTTQEVRYSIPLTNGRHSDINLNGKTLQQELLAHPVSETVVRRADEST